MTLTQSLIFVFVSAILNGSPSSFGQQKPALLNLPVLPAAPFQGKIPLTDALGQLGGFVRGGYVLFGAEIRLKDGKEPTVTFEIKPGTDMASALHGLLDQLDGYEMEVISDHLVDIYPRGSRRDPGDALNLRVPSFSVAGKLAGAILAGPERFIPELKERLTPKLEPGMHRLELYLGLHQPGPAVTVQLRDVTVREILNAVSEATEGSGPTDRPLGWAYLFEPDPNSNVPQHSWKPLDSLPNDWRLRQKSAEGQPK